MHERDFWKSIPFSTKNYPLNGFYILSKTALTSLLKFGSEIASSYGSLSLRHGFNCISLKIIVPILYANYVWILNYCFITYSHIICYTIVSRESMVAKKLFCDFSWNIRFGVPFAQKSFFYKMYVCLSVRIAGDKTTRSIPAKFATT